MASSDWSIIFSNPVESVRLVAEYIFPLYQQHPIEFSIKLFDSVETIPPKTFRLVCYQLFSNGITLKEVLNHLSVLPRFLENCDRVPSENITTLLKYQFPPTLRLSPNDSSESLFFWKSYQKSIRLFLEQAEEIVSETPALDFSIASSPVTSSPTSSFEINLSYQNLDWLHWIYDLSRERGLNLNHSNFVTVDPLNKNSKTNEIRRTLLEEAVFQGSLTHTLDLLKFNVNPGDLSDRLIFNISESKDLLVSGLILRQLVRYGSIPIAKSEPELQKILQNLLADSENNQLLEKLSTTFFQFILSGSQLKPSYQLSQYSSKLDEDEDLLIASEINPEIIDSSDFANIYPHLDRGKFKLKVQKQNSETQVVSGKIVTWPKYIDTTVRGINYVNSYCPSENEDLKIANLPGPLEVYRKVLSYLPNMTSS